MFVLASLRHTAPLLLARLGRAVRRRGTVALLRVLLVVACAIGGTAAHAQPLDAASLDPETRPRLAVSMQTTSNGIGAGLHLALSRRVQLRMTLTGLEAFRAQDWRQDDLDVHAEGRLVLGGMNLLLDWYPFGQTFHLSTGVLLGGPHLRAFVEPTSDFVYSDTKTFTPDKLGYLTVNANASPASPYLGLGWGNALDDHWSLLVDLGMYYLGPPQIEMAGEGLIAPTSRQAGSIEAGLQSFRYLPFVGIGISRSF